ncbi:MAG: hypothetical protein ACYC1I_09715 [Acidimicrobiales bacterium]
MKPKIALEDCWTRLTRAKEHQIALNVACQAIIASEGYTFDLDCDSSGFGAIKFVDRADSQLVLRAATYFGEIVSNLWAARNYVIWNLACLREQSEQPIGWKQLGFPVLDQEPLPTESFAGLMRKTKLAGLDEVDIDKIEAMQPYLNGMRDGDTGLRQADRSNPHYVLEKLAILDRHRRLALLPLHPIDFNPSVEIVSGFGTVKSVSVDRSVIGHPLSHGDVVANFRIQQVTQCKILANPSARVQIFPADAIPNDGTTFADWIDSLVTCVAEVIRAFEPDFQ